MHIFIKESLLLCIYNKQYKEGIKKYVLLKYILNY